MSNLSISNRYSMYSSLISQTYGTGGVSNAVSDGLMGMYSQIYNYGNKGSEVSSSTSGYLVDLKDSASSAIKSISSVKDVVKNKGKISANSSNTDSMTATYTGNEKRDDIKVEVSKVAQAQTNESDSLKLKGSSLYFKNARNISITTDEGKSYSFNYSASITETDEKSLKNIAAKINKANIGVTASVEKDEKTNTGKLVIKGNKTGEGNGFTVSGNLAEAIGIDTVKTEASDAVYSIDGEKKTSSTNKIEVDKELTLNLKEASEKPTTISFGKSTLDSINAARELVNAFNGVANAAYKSDDAGAEKLGDRLKNLAGTYGSSLEKIGVTMNSKGYLEIDEDKMKAAAEKGTIDKFFDSNAKSGLSYGFVNRLENIAQKAYDDPTSFLSRSAKMEVNASDSYYNSIASPTSYNYISAYYKYSNVALLFSAMA